MQRNLGVCVFALAAALPAAAWGDAITTTAGGTIVIGSGSTLSDSATLSGGTNPTGTITFELVDPNGDEVTTESDSVSGNGTYDTPTGILPATTGNYTWDVSYSGIPNTTFSAIQSVTPATPQISTTIASSLAVSGGSVTGSSLGDSAQLTGGYNPTGSLTFSLTNPSGTVVTTETVPVSGNGTYATPTSVVASANGTWTWQTSYSGDTNNNAGSTESETTSVNFASPRISTTIAGGGVVGSSLSDSAVLSGGNNPTGTITFNLINPSGGIAATETVPVSGNGTYATPQSVATSSTGTWTWQTSYSGDANNLGGPVEDEQTAILIATAFISQTTSGHFVGDILSDSALLSGGYDPTGTLTFALLSPTGAVLDSANVAVSGDGSYAAPFTAPASAPGTYTWQVTYGGDANNAGPTTFDQNVPVVPVPVPEPGSLAGFITALASLGVLRRRQRTAG